MSGRVKRKAETCKDCGDVLFQIYGSVYFCTTCGMGQVVDSQLDLQAALEAAYQERANNGGKS